MNQLYHIMIKTFLNSIERAKNQVNDSIFMFTHNFYATIYLSNLMQWQKMKRMKNICRTIKT